ncbi:MULTISPECIES: hypothetical protein [unclassified Veillonella]|uniref:phage tail assembly chaperone n=1 Tax=unclassified Veillonella TaxID=2630086 RepID=UPI000F8E4EE5|nr:MULTISPECIES: hypothetical protein [unclassified Veillonella]
MSLLEKLLSADAGIILKETKTEVEVPRLTKLLGEPFIVELKELPYQQIEEARNFATSGKGKHQVIDNGKFTSIVLSKTIVTPDLADRDLHQKFGVTNKLDCIKKLFKPGEIELLATKVFELSGYSDEAVQDVVEDVKNG